MKINERVKNLWVAAMRSGTYKQIKRAFQQDGGHCALGVLQDVYAKERNVNSFDVDHTSKDYLSWVGEDRSSHVYGEPTLRTVVRWNDDRGLTLKEIADKVEESF